MFRGSNQPKLDQNIQSCIAFEDLGAQVHDCWKSVFDILRFDKRQREK